MNDREPRPEGHTARRLGVTLSMEPAAVRQTIERGHSEGTLNLMVLKTQPERIATIRRMAALPGSGVRPDQVAAIAQAFDTLLWHWPGPGER